MSHQFHSVDNKRPADSRLFHRSLEDSSSSSTPEDGGTGFPKVGQGLKRTTTNTHSEPYKKAKIRQSVLHDDDTLYRRLQCQDTVDDDINRGANCERQPQLSENGNVHKTYGLERSLHGNVYQLKHLMLILRRVWKRDYPFRLWTEINAAEKFDDLVLHYRDNTGNEVHRFLQVKHKQDGTEKITAAQLLDTKNGDFSLLKYFMSWRKIRKQPDFDGSRFKDFILCTNKGLDREGLEKAGIYVSEVEELDEFLEVTNRENQPPRYKLRAEESSRLYDTLKTASDTNQLAKVLAQHVCDSKEVNLRTEIFKYYHIALAKEVVDTEKKRFSDNFISDTHLSTLARNFREMFVVCAKNDTWKRLDDRSLKISSTFGKPTLQSKILSFTELPNDHITNEEISDFLDDFILAVDQPNEKELGRMIKQEIGTDSQFNLLDADLIGDSFQSRMLDWFKETGKHSKFLANKDAENFFNDIEIKLSSVIAMGLSLEYPEVLRKFGIEFEKENETLKRFLTDSNGNSNQILELISPKPLLTALRVHQTIKRLKRFEKNDSFIFIHPKKLLFPKIMDRVLSAFKSPSNHDLLVVDCGSISASHCVKELWNSFCNITMKNTGKKIILITQQPNGTTVQMKVDHEVYHETEADIGIYNLKEQSQEKLLKKMIVTFQGHGDKTNFGRLLGIQNLDNTEAIEFKNLGRVIDLDTLVKIIRDEEIRIGSKVQGLGQVENYYITRKISHHKAVKKNILKARKLSDIFAVSGMAEEKLKKVNVNTHSLENGTEEAQFKTLCEQNPECNIHWLEDRSGKLIWIQSSGDITNLLEFRYTYFTTSLEEDQLMDCGHKENRIIIISDVAGMGKSTILASLAQKMKDKDSSLLVIRIDLTQHTSILAKERASRTFSSNDTNAAVGFLVDKLLRLENNLDSQIYKMIIENQDKAVLLLDGFDEISPTYENIVIDLLLALKNLNIRKLFVTTRPHTCKILETKLGAFPHTLQPFSKGDRIKFLTQFWRQRLNRSGCNNPSKEKLQKHAKSVMDLLTDSINPGMSRFMGIPLQTRMVAEIYQYNVTEGGDSFSKPEVPRTINISDLYEKFVDEKYRIYCEDKKSSDATKPGEAEDSKIRRKIMLISHKKLALEALFEENTVQLLLSTQPKLLGAYDTFCDENVSEEPTGIVTSRNMGKPQFVHLTFAEYFAAVFLVDTLTDGGCSEDVQNFLLGKLFVESQYKTIRVFINCLLSGGTYSENNKPWELDLRQYCNAHQETVYHVAAEERNVNIVKFFLNRLSKHSEQNSSPPNIDLEDKSGWTPLAIAVNNAGKYSSSHSHENGYLAMVKCLVEIGANVNCRCPDGKRPLHIAAAKHEVLSLDVVKYLIDNGADVHSKDENGRTPLYRAAEYGNTRIIDYLVENAAVVDAQDIRGLTPLYAAAYDDSETVIKCLQRNGANCNFEINDQCTLLCRAIKDNDYLTVKSLVSNGADVNFSTKDGIAPLDCARLHNIAVYLVAKGAVSKNPFLRLCRRVIQDARAKYPDFEYDSSSSSS